MVLDDTLSSERVPYGSGSRVAPPADRVYCRDMVDLNLEVPATDTVVVDAETSAAIDRGIKDAEEGRTLSLDEVRKMIPKWISQFESQKPR
jgi:hypothetical protein